MADSRVLDFEHFSLIKKYFNRFPPEISEHTFTNLFSWRRSRPISFSVVEDSLLFFVDSKGIAGKRKILFGNPVGNLPLASAVEILGNDIEGGIRLSAGSVIEYITTGYKLQADRDNADYVYRVEDLALLSGRHYAKKRNQIKKCLKAYHCEYEPVTANIVPQCIAMQQRWCDSRSCESDPALCNEYSSIMNMFNSFEKLDLTGGAIRVDGEIQAFAIAEQLSPGTAVCHFEKALPGVQGLGQLINQWFALYGLEEFVFVNREQDLGIPGLRQAKKSYRPHHLVEKYTLSLGSVIPVCKNEIVQGCSDEYD